MGTVFFYRPHRYGIIVRRGVENRIADEIIAMIRIPCACAIPHVGRQVLVGIINPGIQHRHNVAITVGDVIPCQLGINIITIGIGIT